MELVDIVLDILRVGGDDGAVVVVARVGKLISLIRHAGVEDELQPLADEPGHMAVGQLGRITLGLAGNGLDAQLVNLPRGSRREHHLVLQLGKEGVPEGIILIKVQHTGNAHLAPDSLVRRQGLVAEDPLVLVFVQVRDMILVALLADAALAAVAGDELAAAGEAVDGQAAVVGAALALSHGGGEFQAVDLVDGKHGGFHAFFVALPCDEGRAEGSHDTRDIRAHGLAAGDLLETSKNRVVVEGSALDHDILSQRGGVRHLDDLEKSVLDDGVGKARRDIRHGSALLLGLFYLGIHKYRTAGAQVDGMLREQSRLGEVLHAVIQGMGEGLDKGAAAGGAGLVQLDAVYGMVFDADTLHVLAADVQDTVHFRVEEFRGVVVGHGLHLALVQHQGGLYQGFAVAGGAGADDMGILRKKTVNLLDSPDGGLQGASVIAAVKRVEKLAVLAHQGRLGGGASGVDAQETVSLIGLEIAPCHLMAAVALLELGVLMLGRKKRLHAGHLEIHLDMGLQPLLHAAHGYGRLLFAA